MTFERLHLTGGDSAGESLRQSGLDGGVLVWRDLLYDGTRMAGWPDDEALASRASFLSRATGGALGAGQILGMLSEQYRCLGEACATRRIVLWFDACLFDQAMLAHVLTCLRQRDVRHADLIVADAFPGVVPFHGLGQLSPEQLAGLFGLRTAVTDAQFRFAAIVEQAFANQDVEVLREIGQGTRAPLPHVPAAARRWLAELPDPETGLGRLERLAVDAVHAGCNTPATIYRCVADADTPPQFWGDTTLWATINRLADRTPAVLAIEGPVARLPQFTGAGPALDRFRITTAT